MPPRRRLAWFSPMPPARSGIAAVNAELLPSLRAWYDIDVFVDDPATGTGPEEARRPAETGKNPVSPRPAGPSGLLRPRSAHDFVWLNRQAPYDLTVYQLGNSSLHEYMWPYLFRYPGLAVLHDARLHHARAAALLRAGRDHDYRAEFAASQPDESPDLAELAVKGFDTHLYYYWPMTRLVIGRSRLTAVHAGREIDRLRGEIPGGRVEPIRLGHGTPLAGAEDERETIRIRYGIPPDTVVFGCFGGLSPEKRLPQILAAFAATRAYCPSVRLLLAGAIPGHYDLQADIERSGIGESTIVTGYLESDDDLSAHMAACDVALNLRWPTAREISGPWLRCLSAGVPTIITQLAHLSHVPALDPRTWRPWSAFAASNDEAPLEGGSGTPSAVSVAIDVLDEDHSLRLAMRRLVRDAPLREALARAGRHWWTAHHDPALMLEDYLRIVPLALAQPAGTAPVPEHLVEDGSRTLERVLGRFGLRNPLR